MILKRFKPTICIVAAFCMALLGMSDSAYSAKERPTNVVLIAVDTLRADHMSLYGYERKTTPFIDEFAKEAIVFDQAISPATWTYPSFIALFASRAPRSIIPIWKNILESFNSQEREAIDAYHESIKLVKLLYSPLYRNPVREHLITLADVFLDNGYSTGGFIGIRPLAVAPIDDGFNRYDTSFSLLVRPEDHDDQFLVSPDDSYHDGKLNRQIIKWMEQQAAPFFLFVDYRGPHCPYAPPTGFDVFEPRAEETSILRITKKPYGCGTLLEPISGNALKRVHAAYDGLILATDQRISEIIDKLKSLGLFEDTIVVITSDHGEELAEHRNFLSHTIPLYQSVIHVPLIIKVPGVSHARLSQRVSLIDIAPTLLEIVGIPVPKTFEGSSLIPLIEGTQASSRSIFVSAGPVQNSQYFGFAILNGHYKLIKNFKTSRRDQLYDITHDPGETDDILELKPAIAKSLKAKLIEQIFDDVEASEFFEQAVVNYVKKALSSGFSNIELDFPELVGGADAVEALRSLGYIN